MWVIEHIFVTPTFHYAHHGKSKTDNISDPNGNFGNAFTIWDQIFGTATFTRQIPIEFGLQSDPKDGWASHLFYPFVKSNKDGSEISKAFKKEKNLGSLPHEVVLPKGTYLYCQCGYSANQPFCNGYHNGTKVKSLAFDVKSERKVSLCTCKITKTPPYCDNSHLEKTHTVSDSKLAYDFNHSIS
ncbi:MAG: CDGSH-type Zn-finger protein [Saprospiraceae bacterium]|jgi:CDGSH-type Zn-finger protein